MWKLLRRFIGSDDKPWTVESDDPFEALIVLKAFQSGKPIIGSVDGYGNFEMHEIDETPNRNHGQAETR